MLRYDVAIAGGGFSGVAVAANLARFGDPNLSLCIFEPAELGRGAAYGTPHREHRLNTRAKAMSLYADDPDHFVRWLGDRGGPDDFVSRRLYGDYVAEIGARTFERPRFSSTPARLTGATLQDDGSFLLETENGTLCEAGALVIATGNALPNHDVLPAAIRTHPGYIADPWRFDYRRVGGQVLVIGAGLTALDVLTALEASGHRGRIDVVSRGGHFPQVHANGLAPYDIVPALDTSSARALLRSFRRHVREAAARGFDWRAVVDSIRPESEAIWKRLGVAEQRRFERHLRSHWERHRHRAPQEVDAVRERYTAGGRLTVHAGRVAYGDATRVILRTAAGREIELQPDWIVNCLGLGKSHRLFADPLYASLQRQRLISPEPLGLGVRVDARLCAIGAGDKAGQALWLIGTPVRGARAEATAVPDLRVMAQTIAASVSETLRSQQILTG